MESDSPAILAGTEGGMSRQVAITIKDDHPSSQYFFPHLQFCVYYCILYLMGLPFMALLAALRARIIDKNHPYSPFEIDALFMITSIVALFVVIFTSQIMIATYYYKHNSSTMDIHYKILTYIGGFSAILASFSLAMVLYVHFWTRFLLVCVFLAVVVAFVLYWKYFLSRTEDSLQENESDEGFPKIYFGGLLVPLLLVLVLFIPRNFNFIFLLVVWLYCLMQPVYALRACSLHVISYYSRQEQH